MAFETKEEVLEKILNMERPLCPPLQTADEPLGGAGYRLWRWSWVGETPYLFVCFNDECSSFKKGMG